ncbi:MAG: sugar transferase, partial [Actinomycetota bacterium]
MSLVGPRPPLPGEVERYDEHLGRRLLVKPGITGLWQVSRRHELSFEDYVRYDLLYVQNWSIALDLYILARTIPALLSRRGAY